MKFVAVPNYTYLKLKMPGPHRVITVGTSFQCAYECDLECCELAATTIASEELAINREAVAEDMSDSKRQVGAFEPTEGTEEVSLTPVSLTARCCASAPTSLPNTKARSSTFSA
jgi:hypothetical protein